jgi:hypothetical protein
LRSHAARGIERARKPAKAGQNVQAADVFELVQTQKNFLGDFARAALDQQHSIERGIGF